MSLNCEEHDDLPILTEERSDPLGGKGMVKDRVKLLSVVVYAASESVRILSITCSENASNPKPPDL